MSFSTFFLHECPKCGRRLEIKISHIGSKVTCLQCHGTFVAENPVEKSLEDDRIEQILAKAERFLNSAVDFDRNETTRSHDLVPHQLEFGK